LLNANTFYAFSTGGGLRESSSSTAAGPWSTPTNELMGGLPSWADGSKGVWAPDMIETTSGMFVVYFSAALKGTAGNPPGNDAQPASNARCIGTAESMSPTGQFIADPTPLVCFSQYSPGDPMTDAGNRTPGEGVIDASPTFVTIDGQQRLYLVYKTQADPGKGQPATIRMIRLADADGTTAVGVSHELLASPTGSFADTIEAPSLIQNGSYFILFVAHGNWDSCNYSTEWFKSQNIWAWSINGGTTLLDSSSTSGLCGPGSADVTGSRVAGQDRIFFHAWVAEDTTVNGAKVITTTPFDPNGTPQENVNAARVMYSAVLTFGSDGFTPILGAFQGQ
jgi:beta-xylosidase